MGRQVAPQRGNIIRRPTAGDQSPMPVGELRYWTADLRWRSRRARVVIGISVVLTGILTTVAWIGWVMIAAATLVA